MIIRMYVIIDTQRLPCQLSGTVCHNLVGIHVGACSCTSLYDIRDKPAIELSLNDFITGRYDIPCPLIIQMPAFVIGHGTGLFDHAQRTNHRRMCP